MEWLRTELLPYLKEGMVVVMDNAPWHKGNDIKYLIESIGAKLLKLPPYSPDLNPIEHAWANLKQTIKLNKHKFKNFETNLASQMQNMKHSNMA